MNKHFNKSLIMSEEENLFQQSNSCWICKKLIDNAEEKVRDHFHVTGNFNIKITFLAVLLKNLFVLMIGLLSQLLFI